VIIMPAGNVSGFSKFFSMAEFGKLPGGSRLERITADLIARVMLPGHAGRFCLSNHTWYGPYERITAASHDKPYQLVTPQMGRVVGLNTGQASFAWWEALTDSQSANS